MLEFEIIRLGCSLITLIVVFTAVFVGTRLSGNTLDYLFPNGLDESVRAELTVYFGLDGSITEQYIKFWKGLLQGNLGISLFEMRPVTEIYSERIGNTLTLFISLFFSLVIGLPLGIFAAVKRGTRSASLIMTIAFIGYATPNFILAIFSF